MKLGNFLGAIVGLAENLVVIVTLGHFTPGWEFRFLGWWRAREIRQFLAKERKQ